MGVRMGYIYVMSDLHGQEAAFFQMLEKINFSKEDRLYIIGDVVDRGAGGVRLLRYIEKQENMKLFRGNHEDMMIKSCTDETRDEWFDTWMFNGGGETLQGLEALSEEEREQCIRYVRHLPLCELLSLEKEKILLVHAGLVPKDGTPAGDCQNTAVDDALWVRGEFFDSQVPLEYEIIFGHTPTGALIHYCHTMPEEQRERAKQFKIVHWNHKTGIDCGAAYGKNLGCLRLNDRKEYYVEIRA